MIFYRGAGILPLKESRSGRSTKSRPLSLLSDGAMPEYFDCMRCGHMSIVSAKPPKCPKCGSGAGVVITSQDPPQGASRDGSSDAPRKDTDSPQ